MILHLTILIQIWDDLGRDIQTVFCLDPWAWAMLQVASPWRLEAARPWQWWTASEGQFRWMAEDLAWFHKNLLSRAHRWDISISIYIYVYMDIQYAFTIHYYSFIIFSSCSLHFFAVFRVWSDCDILFDLSILHYLWIHLPFAGWMRRLYELTSGNKTSMLHCLGAKVEDFSESQ